jgi:hypothetical protein
MIAEESAHDLRRIFLGRNLWEEGLLQKKPTSFLVGFFEKMLVCQRA